MHIAASTNSRLERLRQHRSNIRRCARELGIELGGSAHSAANRGGQASSSSSHADLVVVGESAGREKPVLRTSSEVMRTKLKPVASNFTTAEMSSPTVAANAESLAQNWFLQDARMSNRYPEHHLDYSRRNGLGMHPQSKEDMLAHGAQASNLEVHKPGNSVSVLHTGIGAPNLGETFSSSASPSRHMDEQSLLSEESLGKIETSRDASNLGETFRSSASPSKRMDEQILFSERSPGKINPTTDASNLGETFSSSASLSKRLDEQSMLSERTHGTASQRMAQDLGGPLSHNPSQRVMSGTSVLAPKSPEQSSDRRGANQLLAALAWQEGMQETPTSQHHLQSPLQPYFSPHVGTNEIEDPESVLQRIKRDLGLCSDVIEDEVQLPAEVMLFGSNGASQDFVKDLSNGTSLDFLKDFPKDFVAPSNFFQPKRLASHNKVDLGFYSDAIRDELQFPSEAKLIESNGPPLDFFKDFPKDIGGPLSFFKPKVFDSSVKHDLSLCSDVIEHKLQLHSEVVLTRSHEASSDFSKDFPRDVGDPSEFLKPKQVDSLTSLANESSAEKIDHWHELPYSRTDVAEVPVHLKSQESQQCYPGLAAEETRSKTSTIDSKERSGDIGSLSFSPRRPGDSSGSVVGDVVDRLQNSTTSLMLSSTASSVFGSRTDIAKALDKAKSPELILNTLDALRGPADESAGPPFVRSPCKSLQHSGIQTIELQKTQQEFRDAEVDTSDLTCSQHPETRVNATQETVRSFDAPVVSNQTAETQTTPRASSRDYVGNTPDINSPRARPPLIPHLSSVACGMWDGGVLDQFRFSSHRQHSGRSLSSPPSRSSPGDLKGYGNYSQGMSRPSAGYDSYHISHHFLKPNQTSREDCETRNFGFPSHASRIYNNSSTLNAMFACPPHGYCSHDSVPFSHATSLTATHEFDKAASGRDDKLLTRAYEVYRQQQLDLMRPVREGLGR